MARQCINAGAAAAIGPYSHACEANGFVYLSGQTPIDPATGRLVEGSIGAQAEQCFRNLFAVLEAAGLDEMAVVNVQVYLTDMADFATMNAVYQTKFTGPFPARTTIGVASLPLGASIEIGMIAVRKA